MGWPQLPLHHTLILGMKICKIYSAMVRVCTDHTLQSWSSCNAILISISTPSFLWTDHTDHCTTSLFCKVNFQKSLWQTGWPQWPLDHWLIWVEKVFKIQSAMARVFTAYTLQSLFWNYIFPSKPVVQWSLWSVHRREGVEVYIRMALHWGTSTL